MPQAYLALKAEKLAARSLNNYVEIAHNNPMDIVGI